MRCKNCGWENEPGRVKCEKCNAPLSSAAAGEDDPTVAEGRGDNDASLKRTVSERQVFNSVDDASPATPASCRRCGYPMGRGMNVCPNCGTPVQESTPQRPGTVNPWAAPQSGSFCTLKPLAWENERIDHQPLSFSGTAITLNRANTDPNNQTITSQRQAELTFEDGAWYLCDKSAQQTTYVHAGRKARLEKGDVIILGNRRFEFNG